MNTPSITSFPRASTVLREQLDRIGRVAGMGGEIVITVGEGAAALTFRDPGDRRRARVRFSLDRASYDALGGVLGRADELLRAAPASHNLDAEVAGSVDDCVGIRLRAGVAVREGEPEVHLDALEWRRGRPIVHMVWLDSAEYASFKTLIARCERGVDSRSPATPSAVDAPAAPPATASGTCLFLEATAATSVGRRENNEDVYLFSEDLFLVADGMGGHAAGEVAATLAALVIDAAVDRARGSEVTRDLGAKEVLAQAVCIANEALLEEARVPGRQGMGTTVVALHVVGDRAAIVHAGDSRCYRLREGLEQLTPDHSPDGSSMLERCLGVRHEEGDAQESALRAGDVFLLCSDGLNVLPRERVEALLREGCDATALVDAAMALDLPFQDNVTAVVVRVEEAK